MCLRVCVPPACVFFFFHASSRVRGFPSCMHGEKSLRQNKRDYIVSRVLCFFTRLMGRRRTDNECQCQGARTLRREINTANNGLRLRPSVSRRVTRRSRVSGHEVNPPKCRRDRVKERRRLLASWASFLGRVQHSLVSHLLNPVPEAPPPSREKTAWPTEKFHRLLPRPRLAVTKRPCRLATSSAGVDESVAGGGRAGCHGSGRRRSRGVEF